MTNPTPTTRNHRADRESALSVLARINLVLPGSADTSIRIDTNHTRRIDIQLIAATVSTAQGVATALGLTPVDDRVPDSGRWVEHAWAGEVTGWPVRLFTVELS